MDSELANQHIALLVGSKSIWSSSIFPLLSLQEVWRMRLVCKRLYEEVKHYEINEIVYRPNHFEKGNWYSTTEPIKLRNQFPLRKLRILLFSIHLDNLRYLKVENSGKQLTIEDLNYFEELIILELTDFEPDPLTHHHLKLPKLQALFLDRLNFSQCICSDNLIIETPKLRFLTVTDPDIDNRVKFVHTPSVRSLSTRYFKDSLLTFENLECLELTKVFGGPNIQCLLEFKRLNELRILYPLFDLETMRSFLALSCDGQNKLSVVFQGVPMNDALIDEYRSLRNPLIFQLRHYDILKDDLNFVNIMSINVLLHQLGSLNNLQPDFFRKYTNIQEIRIERQAVDEDSFLPFIGNCQNLKRLVVEDSSLSQQFYDQLPSKSQLFDLVIYQDPPSRLRFEFLTKMPYLKTFMTDLNVRLSRSINLNRLRYLEEFNFALFGSQMMVRKEARDEYYIVNFRDLRDYDSVVQEDHHMLVDDPNIRYLYSFERLVEILEYYSSRRRRM